MSKTVQDMIHEDVQDIKKHMHCVTKQVGNVEKELLVLKTEKRMGVYLISTVCATVVGFLFKLLPDILNKP